MTSWGYLYEDVGRRSGSGGIEAARGTGAMTKRGLANESGLFAARIRRQRQRELTALETLDLSTSALSLPSFLRATSNSSQNRLR